MPHGTQCLRRHADDLRSFLHDQKGPQEQGGVALEAIVAAQAQTAPYHAEIVVDHANLIIGQRKQQLFYALHQNGIRSEEHTSELQSLMRISYAVFCLKKKIYYHIDHKQITLHLQPITLTSLS